MHWFDSPSPSATLSKHTRAEPSTDEVVPHRHAVQFYEKDEFLAEAVAEFASNALGAGSVFVSIAATPHQRAFARALEARGAVESAVDSDRLTFLDAGVILDLFMADGMPDPASFREHVGAVIARAAAVSSGPVYAYGEMVDILWREGKIAAAVRLEQLWNELARERDFVLLCAYAMESFADAERTSAFAEICCAHSHVLPTERYPGHHEPDMLREVTRLQ